MSPVVLPPGEGSQPALSEITTTHATFASDAVHVAAERAYRLGVEHERTRWLHLTRELVPGWAGKVCDGNALEEEE